jgi:hypothetical protein
MVGSYRGNSIDITDWNRAIGYAILTDRLACTNSRLPNMYKRTSVAASTQDLGNGI